MLFAPTTSFSAASLAAEVTPSARKLFFRSHPELHWRMPTNRAPETGGPLLAGFCKGRVLTALRQIAEARGDIANAAGFPHGTKSKTHDAPNEYFFSRRINASSPPSNTLQISSLMLGCPPTLTTSSKAPLRYSIRGLLAPSK